MKISRSRSLESDLVPKSFYSSDCRVDCVVVCPGVEVVSSEIGVSSTTLNHVEDGDNERMSQRDDGPFASPTSCEAAILRRWISVLAARRSPAACTSAFTSQLLPCRVRPLSRLPALSLLLGQRPAHEAKWDAEGKRLMSVPISASTSSATLRPTPQGHQPLRDICHTQTGAEVPH